ncbi:predicted protein [Nematostella vectensis]|uniref:Uncharacterized protein n=1 Tax=Nematostella vectensis TaxID=45351 RepID=A7T0P0_NEMVE|nr:predicted protein [Nematostella vectensis]|eukprot:XP_001622579.1 predicted protein [Nematostella vectensis]
MPQNLSDMKDWPGEWICEEQWPSTNNICHLYSLCQKSEKLVQTTSTQESRDPSQRTRSIQSDPACGINGGYNMASSSLDMPTDQSHDDGLSLRWDSCALEHDVSVLGFPEVEFELSSDQPQAQIAVACQREWVVSRGMLGKSWGGFNALQVAALRPPALKAIISAYSSDDRYADDIHYLGGCVMGNSGLAWASINGSVEC